jgi:hypothetical protein
MIQCPEEQVEIDRRRIRLTLRHAQRVEGTGDPKRSGLVVIPNSLNSAFAEN